jgi:protein-S-isoprenylcysteine O-methyltransferase Ste14
LRLNITTLAVAALLFGLMLWQHQWVRSGTPWQIVGVAITAPAFVLFVLARIQLGRAFSVRAKANTLVTSGIYARVRHPIYVFGGLIVAGVVIFAHRPWWLLIFVVLIPLQLFRVRKEERVLEAKFGDAYREYRRKTWF